MAEEPSSETWLVRGIEAYQNHDYEKATGHFEKAVGLDSASAAAHFALGVARLTLYQRRPQPVSTYLFSDPDISEQKLLEHKERERAILAEQNATNWPLAEKSLKQANELDPQNPLIVEYLCALYFCWHDPSDEQNNRMDDAKHWFERLLEVHPHHKYADTSIGMILCGKAGKLLPHYGRWPPVPESDLVSLRMKVGPLLEEARRHLERAFAAHGNQTAASHFLDKVASMQDYLADPDKAARRMHDKLAQSFREHFRAEGAEGESAGRGRSATVTFRLSPEALAEDMARPFPPNPWRIPVR